MYLEQIDLILFCAVHQVELQFLTNTTGRLQTVSVRDYLRGICESLPLLPEIAPGQAPWHVILTRADFEPSDDPSELNHWLPAWEVPAETAAEEKHRLHQASVTKRRELFRLLSQAEDDGETDAIMEALQEQADHQRNFQKLVDRLHEATGLLARDVGREGNCGIWAFLGLQSGSPFMAGWGTCLGPAFLLSYATHLLSEPG